MIKNKEDYPMILEAKHIQEILGVSKPTAYELMERADFPLIRIGRLKRVTREAFFQWLSEQQSRSL